jgi:creatinine amidohydrolase
LPDAKPAEPLSLGEMTPVDVRRYLEQDDRIVIPFGSIENNGPHLPLATDLLVAAAVANRSAGEAGVVVAPAIPWGLSSVNMAFAGTMTVSAPTCQRLIVELCASLAFHGFRRFALVTGHYNNVWPAAAAAEELRDRGLLVAQLDVWRTVEHLCRDLAVSHELPFGHGSEIMTSVVLSVAGDSVRLERMAKELPPESYGIAYYKTYPRVMGYAAWDDVTQSGLVGDPTNATSEVGDEVVRRLVSELSRLLGDMADAPIPTERSFQ